MRLIDKLLHTEQKRVPLYIRFTDATGTPQKLELVDFILAYIDQVSAAGEAFIPADELFGVVTQLEAIPAADRNGTVFCDVLNELKGRGAHGGG